MPAEKHRNSCFAGLALAIESLAVTPVRDVWTRKALARPLDMARCWGWLAWTSRRLGSGRKCDLYGAACMLIALKVLLASSLSA